MLRINDITIYDCEKEYKNNNEYRYLVTKFGQPHTLCKSKEDALEIVNNTEFYGVGFDVIDLENIEGA